MLGAKWLLIVLAGLVGVATALAIAAAQVPKYTATADVFVTVTSGQSTGDLAQGGTFSQDQARNFAAVVPREKVLGPVIAELGLNTTLDDLRKQIDVEVPLNTSLITIKATDPSPQMSAQLANAVARYLKQAVADLSPTVSGEKGTPVRAELIGEAKVPVKTSSPIIPLFAVLGGLAGLVLAIGYLVVVELLVAKVDSTEQIEAATHSTVLASVPRDRMIGRHPIAVTARPLSLRAENIRQARTALKFLPGETNQTFVITSSVSGEGKSTTAANIAAAFAAEGLSTCLVEADLRRPRLEGLLDLTGGSGLSDIIVGHSKIEDTLQPWGPDNLQVILAGTVPPNASELLGSVRGEDSLRSIVEQFDVTIIDTPPLTAVTDAAIIGRMFGGVVLIVGAGKVRFSELNQAMSALSVADVPVRGTVMNLAKGDDSRPYAYAYSERGRQSKFAAALPQTWRPVIKVAVALVAAVAVTLATVALSTRPVAAGAAGATPVPTSTAVTTPATQKVAAFIGDSLVAGRGGEGVRWTSLLSNSMNWQEVNLGLGGTGYVKSSNKDGCGLDYCAPFPLIAPTAIDRSPDVVIVSGGINDAGSNVTQAATTLFTSLRTALPKAQIIALSPVGRATGYPTELAKIRDEIKAAAASTGVTFVDIGNPLQGRPDLYFDETHPNAAGYKVLADTITKAIRKL
jgi:polysaccharide biosynthesis transport protein